MAGIGTAQATPYRVALDGYIDSVSTSLLGFGVAVGDPFHLQFTFDDSEATTETVYVNGGDRYENVQNYVTAELSDWSGAFSQFAEDRYDYSASIGIRTSWYRNGLVFHHDEWSIGDLAFVTDYAASKGESYGWYNYGSQSSLSLFIASVATTPIAVSTVPEPGTYYMLLTGLGLMSMIRRRQRRQIPVAIKAS